MLYVEAPIYPDNYPLPAVFLAGGITGCRQWQTELIGKLGNVQDGTILNPRRAVWPEAADELEKQIRWEASFLWRSQIISFWFSKETVCPITLFELGCQLVRYRMTQDESKRIKICIGIDPGYPRALDLSVQMGLLAPDIPIFSNLDDVATFIARGVEALK